MKSTKSHRVKPYIVLKNPLKNRLETPVYFFRFRNFFDPDHSVVRLTYLIITKCKSMFVSKTMNLNLVSDILLHHQLNPLLFLFYQFTLIVIKKMLNGEIKK
jgi:hypothetical protein